MAHNSVGSAVGTELLADVAQRGAVLLGEQIALDRRGSLQRAVVKAGAQVDRRGRVACGAQGAQPTQQKDETHAGGVEGNKINAACQLSGHIDGPVPLGIDCRRRERRRGIRPFVERTAESFTNTQSS